MSEYTQSGGDQLTPGGFMIDMDFFNQRLSAEAARRGKTDTIQVGDVAFTIVSDGVMVDDRLISWDTLPAVIALLEAMYKPHRLTARQETKVGFEFDVRPILRDPNGELLCDVCDEHVAIVEVLGVAGIEGYGVSMCQQCAQQTVQDIQKEVRRAFYQMALATASDRRTRGQGESDD